MTVWVTHLSNFWAGVFEFCDGAQGLGPEAYDGCLLPAIAGAGVFALGAGVYEGIKALVGTPAQPGGGGTSTGSSGPAIPVSSTPVNGGGLQGPTVNPQEPAPTTNPQPAPAPRPTPEEQAPPPPAPPPPPPVKSIEIGWSGAHAGWIWMTLNGFSTGSHEYACDFASGGDASFTLGETESPQTWDNGQTCRDEESGDSVWVVVEGVASNTITVP